jgi:hypothetical protein
LQSSPLCSFLHPLIASSLLAPSILLSTPKAHIHSSFKVTDRETKRSTHTKRVKLQFRQMNIQMSSDWSAKHYSQHFAILSEELYHSLNNLELLSTRFFSLLRWEGGVWTSKSFSTSRITTDVKSSTEQ